MKNKAFIAVVVLLFLGNSTMAQIPVEVFAGDKRATLDILFFKYFKNKEGQNTDWLFFNRNRATIDYQMTTTTNLPQFGFTEAISYNPKKLKGFAPVAVVQLLNRGVYPKMGVQYVKISKNYLIFTWLVSELKKEPTVDFFVLVRYTPKISEKLNLFTQVELVNAFPTIEQNNYNFIQRVRLGLKKQETQFGLGADFTALGRNNFTNTQNMGVFIRHEF